MKLLKEILTNRFVLLFCIVLINVTSAKADERVKTLLYSEYKVFDIVTKPGLQTVIEFDEDEEILGVSVGDKVAWRVTPATNMVFIKALQKKNVSNLTIITTDKNYQFELISNNNAPKSKLAYVVRFHFPEGASKIAKPKRAGDVDLSRPVTITAPKLPTNKPIINVPSTLPVKVNQVEKATYKSKFNFNYSLDGDRAIEPYKIYDDGAKTYLQYAHDKAAIESIKAINPANGMQEPVRYSVKGQAPERLVVVDKVVPLLIVHANGKNVAIFNENIAR